MAFTKVNYSNLTPKQQEIYNFQKAAGVLAGYGFNCIKLADDWQGADFLAYHKDGVETLKVQLKSRPDINKKYCNKDLWTIFPIGDGNSWCLIKHDELVDVVGEHTNWLNTKSWIDKGHYHAGKPSKKLANILSSWLLS